MIESQNLSQIASKCHALQELEILGLSDTTSANRTKFIEFAGQVASFNSNILSILEIGYSGSTAEEGDAFMHTLVKSQINSLQKLSIYYESNWFENGRE